MCKMTPFMLNKEVTKGYCTFSPDKDICKFIEKSSRGIHINLVTAVPSGEELGLGVRECETANFKMTLENGM